MILVDLNVLLYAVNEDSPHHAPAKAWLEEALSGTEVVGLPWIVVLGFLRLATRSFVVERPLDPLAALDLVDQWLSLPNVRAVAPGPQHWPLVRSLLQPLGTAGNLTTDAHVAALTLEQGATLCTTDGDFRRFPGVRVVNPLGGLTSRRNPGS